MNVPLYQKILEELCRRISGGVYPLGSMLPPEPKLCEEFGVSKITVRRALQELELDGLIERRQGLGNVVKEPSESITIGLTNFTTQVATGRLRLVRTLLEDNLVQASEAVAQRLGVQTGSLLRHLVRLDSEGGLPLSLDEAFIPPALASGITHIIAASPTFMHGWQQAAGISLAKTHYEISVELATPSDQQQLHISPTTPVLVTGELVFDAQERPSLWIITRYRGDRCQLSGIVTLQKQRTKQGVIGE